MSPDGAGKRLGGRRGGGQATPAWASPRQAGEVKANLLPHLHPPAVRLLLRYCYSGLPSVVDCQGDPLLAVECLRAADASAAPPSAVEARQRGG